MKRVINEFSQAVFNLPWLVAQEEGLFAQEDIEVEFLRARQWDTVPHLSVSSGKGWHPPEISRVS